MKVHRFVVSNNFFVFGYPPERSNRILVELYNYNDIYYWVRSIDDIKDAPEIFKDDVIIPRAAIGFLTFKFEEGDLDL